MNENYIIDFFSKITADGWITIIVSIVSLFLVVIGWRKTISFQKKAKLLNLRMHAFESYMSWSERVFLSKPAGSLNINYETLKELSSVQFKFILYCPNEQGKIEELINKISKLNSATKQDEKQEFANDFYNHYIECNRYIRECIQKELEFR
ncbi:hypothetical protein QV05_07700 [Gallibacterium genomosp. 1]|uniref:DUF4760 domain-containing protein n=1 Tax=Gallibacterium genomosp. 1 TaxID=155515 RepID=A0AB36DVF9_9PAST|nr:hypothetical protein [Gallibacterium genomosp. 1]OBX00465.1 hypothetical protein QV05_07700 [Gallibacterium genomosp. 1]